MKKIFVIVLPIIIVVVAGYFLIKQVYLPSSTNLRESWTKLFESTSKPSLDDITKIESLILKDGAANTSWLGDLLSQDIIVGGERPEFTAGVLAKIGTPEAVKAILNAYNLKQANISTKENLLNVFDLIKDLTAAPLLFDEAVATKDLRLWPILINTVARLADNNFQETLISRLSPPAADRIQFVANSVLVKVPSNTLAPLIIKHLSSNLSSSVLSLFCTKLGDDGSESSIMALRSQLNVVPANQQQIVLDGIFRIHNEKSLSLLQKLALEDKNKKVREFAIYAFGNFPPKVALPILAILSSDPRSNDMQSQIKFIINTLEKQK
jgi:hypothetical protein